VNRKSLRTFGLGLAVVCAIVSWRLTVHEHAPAARMLQGAAVLAFVLAWSYPLALKPVYRALMAVAHVLGWINTRILLGLTFYLLFTPVALFFRLIGKDPLDRGIDRGVSSYWRPRAREELDRDRFEHQF
jgi:hypothetical protein